MVCVDAAHFLVSSGLAKLLRVAQSFRTLLLFFQHKYEWMVLAEGLPDLFEKAKSFEKIIPYTDQGYRWLKKDSLE